MKYELEISKVTVLLTCGTDRVCLHTTLPPPYPKEVTDQPLVIQFDTSAGKGADYVRRNFGIEPEVIDTTGKGRK